MPDSPRSEVVAYIGLGANLGDAQATLCWAIDQLAALPGCHLLACSSFYRSAPFEADGPDFINAVISLQTSMDVRKLLLNMQQIENRAGRERPYHHAPRTLDLDILLYGQDCIDHPDLVVPHPRMTQRAFVLFPLSEIAPEQVSAQQLAVVKSQRIERLVTGEQ
ncbi:MAG: 2-amino-4-hydroxy-6-hydroxymethyldihydropteridine diphosphokinase [Comamonadaceae bacterium]|nr:MAG: 2-amino-4-hydroxy-6-hydroxymethyldihydropteridine diphosphokinase [Comamonadaceae bacterium]